jgi:argininosuccinate lyase
MQEDKECVFDAIDTVKACLQVFAPMLKTSKVLKENMLLAAKKGFINATDCADYLTKKGVPFRTAYKITGTIVGDLIKQGKTLEQLSILEYKSYSPVFESDIFDAIDLVTCVNKRNSQGGTGFNEVKKQVNDVWNFISNNI